MIRTLIGEALFKLPKILDRPNFGLSSRLQKKAIDPFFLNILIFNIFFI